MFKKIIKNPNKWKNLSRKELKKLQLEIADSAILKDKHNSSNLSKPVGIDQAFTSNKVFSCSVLMTEKEIKEFNIDFSKIQMPYIPGLLAFREMPAALKSIKGLKSDPGFLLIDGSGIIHPRFAGFATHLGVALDIPSIGVTKNLLCGETKEPKKECEANPVHFKKKKVGYTLLSKKGCRPIYISPGHRFSPETALKTAEKWLHTHKLPEPIFYADKKVNKAAKSFK